MTRHAIVLSAGLCMVLFMTWTAYAADAPDIQYMNGNEAPYSTANIEFYGAGGEYSWTVPEGVKQIKVSSVGAGGSSAGRKQKVQGSNRYNVFSFGGGGGDVIENVVLETNPGDILTIVVGKVADNSDGSDSYVIYNEQNYAVAAGGEKATNMGYGSAGGSGGGSGGYAWIYASGNTRFLFSDGKDGKYGVGGKSNGSPQSGIAGGGASWGDGAGSDSVSGGIGSGAMARAYSSYYTPLSGRGGAVFISYATLNLNDASISLAVDDTYRLTATVSPYDATTRDDCTWTSSDSSIAAVDAEGLVTAIKRGVAVVTATTLDGCFSDSCVVMVTEGTRESKLCIIPEYGEPMYATALVNAGGAVLSYPGTAVEEEGRLTVAHQIPLKRFKIGAKVVNSLVNGLEAEPDASDFTSTPLYLAAGDLNSDNVIDGSDWSMIVQAINYPPETEDGLAQTGDLNGDGLVNAVDRMIFNTPISFSGETRFLAEGYDMSTPAAVSALAATSKRIGSSRSILTVSPAQDSQGTYAVTLSDGTPSINMLQISIACDDPHNLRIYIPEGWEKIGEKLYGDAVVFAIGNAEQGGLSLPVGRIASVDASSKPRIAYSGETPSKMELATAGGIETFSFDNSVSAKASQHQTSGAYSGSGCNAGNVLPALSAFAPFIIKKSRDRRKNK